MPAPRTRQVSWRLIGAVSLATAFCASLTWTVVGPLGGVEMEVNNGSAVRHPLAAGGLDGLRERVSAIGGRVEASPSQDGFRVEARVPAL